MLFVRTRCGCSEMSNLLIREILMPQGWVSCLLTHSILLTHLVSGLPYPWLASFQGVLPVTIPCLKVTVRLSWCLFTTRPEDALNQRLQSLLKTSIQVREEKSKWVGKMTQDFGEKYKHLPRHYIRRWGLQEPWAMFGQSWLLLHLCYSCLVLQDTIRPPSNWVPFPTCKTKAAICMAICQSQGATSKHSLKARRVIHIYSAFYHEAFELNGF